MQKVYCNLIGDHCSLVRTYTNEKIYDVTFKEYRLGRVIETSHLRALEQR